MQEATTAAATAAMRMVAIWAAVAKEVKEDMEAPAATQLEVFTAQAAAHTDTPAMRAAADSQEPREGGSERVRAV